MDHTEAFGDCVSCHNNQAVPGKPPDHPPAGDNCDTCHLTSTFEVVVFGQSGLSGDSRSGIDRATVRAFDIDRLLDQPRATCAGCADNASASGSKADTARPEEMCGSCGLTER